MQSQCCIGEVEILEPILAGEFYTSERPCLSEMRWVMPEVSAGLTFGLTTQVQMCFYILTEACVHARTHTVTYANTVSHIQSHTYIKHENIKCKDLNCLPLIDF